ncbi:unnamed protein product, partial [marine sediment metagenome]
SNIKKIAQSSFILSAGSLLNRFFETLGILLLAIYLTTDDFGRYVSIFVYLSFWALIVDLGVNAILLRESARDKESAFELMRNGFTIGIIMSLFIIFASYITLKYLDYPDELNNSINFKNKFCETLFIIETFTL